MKFETLLENIEHDKFYVDNYELWKTIIPTP